MQLEVRPDCEPGEPNLHGGEEGSSAGATCRPGGKHRERSKDWTYILVRGTSPVETVTTKASKEKEHTDKASQ